MFQLYQEAVDKFGDKEHCRPSSCLISVYGSPDAVPFLNYSVPLVGVVEPVTLNIHRARRNPPPPSTSNRKIISIVYLFNINQILLPPPPPLM